MLCVSFWTIINVNVGALYVVPLYSAASRRVFYLLFSGCLSILFSLSAILLLHLTLSVVYWQRFMPVDEWSRKFTATVCCARCSACTIFQAAVHWLWHWTATHWLTWQAIYCNFYHCHAELYMSKYNYTESNFMHIYIFICLSDVNELSL